MEPLKFLLMMIFTTTTRSAKFLLVPGPSTSHCLEVMSIGDELLKRGHGVTLFATFLDPKPCLSRFNIQSKMFKVVSPRVDESEAAAFKQNFGDAQKNLRGHGNFLRFLMTTKTSMTIYCTAAISDADLLKELEKDRYDFAVIEGLPITSCLFGVAVHLGVPYAAIASVINMADTGLPMQTNTFPNFVLDYTNEMTYKERFINAITFFLNPIFKRLIMPSLDFSEYSDALKGVDTRDLIKDSVLFLENSDYFIDYPKALFPNFVQVGALTASKADPLPSDLNTYMQSAVDGVILVTFGSVRGDLPEDVFNKVIDALQRFKQRVIFKHSHDENKGNVMLMKWVQQNDVLGHQNTKLFISHCGKNGFWESVYHGVPIICVPFGIDTIANGIKVKKHGIGSSINIFEVSADEIYETVKSVLDNKQVVTNMKKMSALLRDRPETSAQRGASALEHVIKYGGEHMRPPTVGFASVIYADIWIPIFIVIILIFKLICLCCRKCCNRKKEAKSKTE